MNLQTSALLWLSSCALLWSCSGPATPATPAATQDASSADTAAGDVLSGNGTGDTAADAAADSVADAGPATPVFLPPAKPEGAVAILDYNVMCSFCGNSDHPEWLQKWQDRVPMLQDVLARADADLVGVQELQAILPTKSGKTEIEELLGPDTPYAWYYHHAKAGDPEDKDYPDAVVAWKKARFDLLQSGDVWLSPTPDKPLSWGLAGKAQFPRLMVWVKLHDKQRNRDLYFGSTHFDNNAPSQEKSSPIALKYLGALTKDAPLLMTGDFNSDPDTVAYKLLVAGQTGVSPPWQDAFELAKAWTIVHNQPVEPKWDPKSRIDHIFLAGGTFTVSWWGLDLWRYGAFFQAPSDHDGAMISHVDW